MELVSFASAWPDDESALSGAMIGLVMYLSFTIPLFIVAGKLRCSSRWMALVPVLFIFILAGCASDEGGPDFGGGIVILLVLLLPFGGLIIFARSWAHISENTEHRQAWGWLMLIPPLILILPWVIAIRAVRSPDPFAQPALA